MSKDWLKRSWLKGNVESRSVDFIIALAIFLATFLIFWFSPVHQVTDSNYSMLLSDCLLRQRTFALDACDVPFLEPRSHAKYVTNGGIYQQEIVRNRIYYFFPVGSSVLSIPYVAIARGFGVSPRNTDGSFNMLGEIAIELSLAAILMALLTSLFFIISRMLLPLGWSVLVALAGSLGSQIWSTASRGLWSHTWSTLLAGCVVYILMAHETGRRRLCPIVLATLLAWLYFVRPTNSIVILGVTGFIALCYKHSLLKFLSAGAVWLLGFIYYSWHNFGQLLPNYYRADRLLFDVFPTALKGNLISPSRGLLVFVPITLFVAFLLMRYWKYRPVPRFTWLALFVVFATLTVISGFAHWWGGASFGPRFSTDAVPWLVLLGIIGVRAMLNWREQNQPSLVNWSVQLACGAILLVASIFINSRGALSLETWRWNPGDVSQLGNKLWDWRQPQFLAGLIAPPLDRDYAPISVDRQIDFTKPEQSNQYLWYGWSNAEKDLRWTEGREATLVFALNNTSDLTLKMKVLPFIREGLIDQQRILIDLNGTPIDSVLFSQNQDAELSVSLPGNLLRRENILKFRLPDAASPELLKISTDQRMLGFAIYWIELKPTPQTSLNSNGHSVREAGRFI